MKREFNISSKGIKVLRPSGASALNLVPPATAGDQGVGRAVRKLGRMLRQRGSVATLHFLISRVFRYEVRLVYQATLQELAVAAQWNGNESLLWFNAESLIAAMTPQLWNVLGEEAAHENLEGVRGGDELYVVTDGTGYLHRGYVLFKTRSKKLIDELEATPLIAYCFTAPSFRGRGLYRRALIAVLWHLKAKGYPRAIIEVDHDNLSSIKGIEAAGFSGRREIRLWILLNSLVIRRIQNHAVKQWRVFCF